MAKGKYKRKRLNKIRRETYLKDTELSVKIVKALANAEIYTLFNLERCSKEQLKNISGIGEKYIKDISDFKVAIKDNI